MMNDFETFIIGQLLFRQWADYWCTQQEKQMNESHQREHEAIDQHLGLCSSLMTMSHCSILRR